MCTITRFADTCENLSASYVSRPDSFCTGDIVKLDVIGVWIAREIPDMEILRIAENVCYLNIN